jgi:tetratricopeptide (TPR) repeat protein
MRVLVAALVGMAMATGMPAAAAEVTVRPRLGTPNGVVGEPATLDVEIQGTQSAETPNVEVPEGVRIEYRGQSTQMSVVNGAMSASLTHSFLLVADRPGSFVLGPITVRADGRTVDGGRVRWQVAAAGARAATGAAPEQPVRLVVQADKTRAYLHERIAVRFRLEIGNLQVTDVRYPTVVADGFAIDKLAEPTQVQEPRADGMVHVVSFASHVVPLRAGDLTIGASQQLSVVTRRGNPLFDHFFGMDPTFGGRKNVTLEAEPVQVTVLPLPEAGRPPSFGGAVGTFTLEVTAQPREVRAGDPVTLSVALRGTGNLAHAEPPAVAGSDTLKAYPPTTIAEKEAGLEVEKRLEQVVIPQAAGDVVLPALGFSFFDPASGRYRTAATQPIPVRVLPAPASPAPLPAPAAPAPAAAPSETIGRDLVSIKDDPGRLVARDARRYRSVGFWLLQLVPLAAWLGGVAWDRRRRRLSGDERYARFTRAGAAARVRLREARAALGAGGAPFYDALARVLHEYLAAKLDLPPGAVSAAGVQQRLRALGASDATVEEAGALLGLCERARFAPAGAEDMSQALGRAEALVQALERQKKLGRAVAAAALAALALVSVARADGDSPKTIFFRGNALYGDGKFAEAAQAYEAVRAAGVESAPLYYNLGTAYARAGDEGRALLNYERARRLAPGDPDLRANMTFVRGDRADDGAAPLWVRLLLPLADRVGSDALLLAAAVAWWLLLAALLVGRLAEPLRRVARWGIVAATLTLLLTLPAAAYRAARVDRPQWAAVLADAAVRFEPSESGTEHFEAPAGSVVDVLAERAGWAQVARRGDGLRGWLPLAAIERF